MSVQTGAGGKDFRVNHISRRLLPSHCCQIPELGSLPSCFRVQSKERKTEREAILSSFSADVWLTNKNWRKSRYLKLSYLFLTHQIAGLKTQSELKGEQFKLMEWKMKFYKDTNIGALCHCSAAEPPANIFCSSPVHTLQQLESIWHLQTHRAWSSRCGWAKATEAVILSGCMLRGVLRWQGADCRSDAIWMVNVQRINFTHITIMRIITAFLLWSCLISLNWHMLTVHSDDNNTPLSFFPINYPSD